jgi:hypothetical protein
MPELPVLGEVGRCETCRFWDARNRRLLALDGQCRRFPPVPFFDVADWCDDESDTPGTRLVESHFPQTYGDDWCGEYRPRDEAAPAEPGRGDGSG